MKTNKILICGSGELGSRYLQGLKSCILPLEVNVFDINKRALSLAKRRWEEKEFQGFNHTVSYLSSLNSLKDDMDICIVTTTANNRLDAIKNICASTNVRNWILEKVLVQNSEELKSLYTHFGEKNKVWVNIPRREMVWHQEIKQYFQSQSEKISEINVYGGNWGLACNSIHFLDLFLSFWDY